MARQRKTHRAAEQLDVGPLRVAALDSAAGAGALVTFVDPAWPAGLREFPAPSHARCGVRWDGTAAHALALRVVRGDVPPGVLLVDYAGEYEPRVVDAWGRPHADPAGVLAEFRRLVAAACPPPG
jgi:hypothetical protein